MACKSAKQKTNITTLNYPETKTVDTIDTYFDIEVKDPYRWLEDDRSKETGDWVAAQNKATFGFLNNIPYRHELKERLSNFVKNLKNNYKIEYTDLFNSNNNPAGTSVLITIPLF